MPARNGGEELSSWPCLISRDVLIPHKPILVGGIPTPMKKIWKSVGIMKFPIYGKIKHVPNHQPVYYPLFQPFLTSQQWTTAEKKGPRNFTGSSMAHLVGERSSRDLTWNGFTARNHQNHVGPQNYFKTSDILIHHPNKSSYVSQVKSWLASFGARVGTNAMHWAKQTNFTND